MATRGNKLFRDFVNNENQPTKLNERGRSTLLVERRNTKLCYRYYYYTRIQRLSFDDTMKALEMDFDLSHSTLGQLITKLAKLITEIGNARPQVSTLKEIYPMMNWIEPKGVIATINELKKKEKDILNKTKQEYER